MWRIETCPFQNHRSGGPKNVRRQNDFQFTLEFLMAVRLEGFQWLDRALEADRAGREVVLRGGLGDHRVDEIVGQHMPPDFLASEFRSPAVQDIHRHGWLQRFQISLRASPPALELRQF